MAENPNRVMTTIRLPPDLLEWSGQEAKRRRMNRTRLIEELLTALREDRLTVTPRPGPNAFPADELVIGATPQNPALVAAPAPTESP